MDPFGTNIPDVNKVSAIKAVRELVAELPETTCAHRGECCKGGCPNMTYGEYLSIREAFVDKMSKEEWLELLMRCIGMYLQKQEPLRPKPCLWLTSDNKCSIYAARPYRCRTYGLVPSALYKQMVKQVAKESKVPQGKLPLCKQCPHVRMKDSKAFPGGRLPREVVERIEKSLKENDITAGLPKNIVDSGMGYLTYHDWHVMTELGESYMVHFSELRTKLGEKEKESFLSSLKSAVAELVR